MSSATALRVNPAIAGTVAAVAYLLRSTDGEEQSIRDQRAEILRFADEHDYHVDGEYVDDAVLDTSAGTPSEKRGGEQLNPATSPLRKRNNTPKGGCGVETSLCSPNLRSLVLCRDATVTIYDDASVGSASVLDSAACVSTGPATNIGDASSVSASIISAMRCNDANVWDRSQSLSLANLSRKRSWSSDGAQDSSSLPDIVIVTSTLRPSRSLLERVT